MGTENERVQEGTGENQVPGGYVRKNLFTSENQPSPEAKSEGQKEFRRKKLHELKGKAALELLLSMPYKGPGDKKLKQIIIDYFGVEEEELTNEVMMDLRQVESAIRQGNTGAYNAIKNRIYGQPNQRTKLGFDDDEPTNDFLKLLMETSKRK